MPKQVKKKYTNVCAGVFLCVCACTYAHKHIDRYMEIDTYIDRLTREIQFR